MGYNKEMELALLEMASHPEFIDKKLFDELDANELVDSIHQNSHRRLNGWYRKRMYRKKLVRRFLSCNPDLVISDIPGTRMRNAVVICDFKDEPFNPRHDYRINLYEKLYISPAGDIRLCKKRLVHHGSYNLFGIFSNDIPDAKKYTNRRIRSKAIRMEDSIPSSPAYYKKQYSRLINQSI